MALRTSSPQPYPQAGWTGGGDTKAKRRGGASSNSTSGLEEPPFRPVASRGASNVSSNTTATSGSTTDNEASKTRRGLSKILLTARNSKSSSASSVSAESTSTPTQQQKSPATSVTQKSPALSAVKAGGESNEDVDEGASIAGSFKTSKSNSEANRRIAFLTEQVSHHPPISSFFVECKEAGVELYGVDQLSAKFTGTSE